jgi:type VI secretion system protein ImpM
MKRESIAPRAPARGLGWYGKVPAAGDFVHRHLPRELIAWWDKWLQTGLAGLHLGRDDAAARGFAAAPLWNFAIPAGPGIGLVQFGAIASSRDRVGRAYPLCITLYLPVDHYHARMLERAGDYYRRLGASLLMAVRHGCSLEQLDHGLEAARGVAAEMRATAPAGPAAAAPVWRGGSDIMDVLNTGHDPVGQPLVVSPSVAPSVAWPDLPLCFNPASHTSYWWTNQADGAPLQTYLHGGGLNAVLFSKLFSSVAGWR